MSELSCFINQLRVKDFYVYSKPYTALVKIKIKIIFFLILTLNFTFQKVDPQMCGLETKEFMTWFVDAQGPKSMGDGEYTTNMIYKPTDVSNLIYTSNNMYATLVNLVEGGNIKSSKLYWNDMKNKSRGDIKLLINVIIILLL